MKTSFVEYISNAFFRAVVPVALAAAVSACSDYIEAPGPDFTVSDEPTCVTVSFAVPSMTAVSRADLSNAQLKQVNSVWVRTYSSITGKATCDWVRIETGHSDEHISHTADLKTKSGYNFIVAVANVENPGVTVDENGNISEEKPLGSLLEAADTWQEFLAISACAPNTTEQLFNGISQQYPTIPMSGIYTTASDMKHPDGGWESACYTPIFIPVDNGNPYKLPGMIHLRRLISQINFNIMPGDDVTISPQSFTVVNAPNYSWLYERQSGVDGVNSNPGDACTQDTKDNFYTTSEQFAGNYIYPLTGNGVPAGSYTFNYWQGENKHMALPASNCDTYNKRELENKRESEGAVPGTSSSLQNTGVYVSLSGNTWTPNNMASYVILRCDVTLKNTVNVEGRDYTREGNGIYVIHLGYCEGDDTAGKAADFNCRRNINYTYNITIKDINNIYVEAVSDIETQPGAEGLVSDVENKTIMLDCHYGAFNVYLTDEELGFTHDTDYTFGYIVQAFFGGTEYSFDENNPPAESERALVRWIELRPTTGENVLADYKPLAPKSGNDGKTFTLDMVHDGLPADCRSSSGWYTVFVNEYVYEADADESAGADNWTKYVNQDNRRAYIRVRHGLSADGESAYAQSKYGVSQRSIQTYYSLDNYTTSEGNIPAKTAIGVEHTNELRGLNMRRSYAPTGVLDANNGRYNVWAWLNGTTSGTAPQSGSASKSWSNIVQTNVIQSIPAVTNTNQYYTQAASVQNLPALAQYTGTLNPSAQDPAAGSSTRSDYIEAINACMSRNRDLNGNGTIEPEELRWYVPALGKYLRMILGRNSLQTPLMDYANTQRIYTGPNSNENGYATRLLVYASNNYALWAMEGLSSSTWDSGSYPMYTQGGPWEVRCIRNLGSNLSTVTPGEKVSAAYSHNATKRVVTMSYYDLNSIRTEKFTQDGTPMVLHNIANQEYNRCYYAFQYNYENSAQTNGYAMNSNNGIYTPCATLNNSDPEKRWRVPNQKELTIMQNLGVLSNTPTIYDYYISCTVSYYSTSGLGMTLDATLQNRKVMAALHNASNSNATQIEFNNNGYVRCVRDVDPDEL